MAPKEENSKHEHLPPDQISTPKLLKWGEDHPTIGEHVPKVDLKKWALTVEGEVENPLKLDWKSLLKQPKVKSTSDFHCVEGWSVLGLKWEGVGFQQIVKLVRPKRNARSVTFECADGYTTSLTLEELMGNDVVLAYRLDGKPLKPDIGAPLRLVVPSKYAYKNAMWVTTILFTAEKQIGYWESRGYSDTADVWKNDRFSK